MNSLHALHSFLITNGYDGQLSARFCGRLVELTLFSGGGPENLDYVVDALRSTLLGVGDRGRHNVTLMENCPALASSIAADWAMSYGSFRACKLSFNDIFNSVIGSR